MSTVWCFVQAAHLCAQSCDSLVHHSSVEELEVRKRGSDRARMTRLRVRSITAWGRCCGKFQKEFLADRVLNVSQLLILMLLALQHQSVPKLLFEFR